MSGKRLDLDAALVEHDAADEPLLVTFFGEEWELPGTLPAMATVRIASWFEEGLVDEDGERIEGTEIPPTQCLLLLRDMVPEDILAEWCRRGLGITKYAAAVENIMASYQLAAQADQMGKAIRPANRAARRAPGRASAKSSTGGRSSKRTSTASTRSRTSSRS